jgi:NAD(P)H dehydrogenase (quinone)
VAALVVHAHPLAQSLSGRLAARVAATLRGAGHKTEVLDLYADGFEPRLSAREREAYYGPPAMAAGLERHAALLQQAEVLVFVFPTWWFGPPAILKGWIDRVFAPDIAFDHSPGFGPIVPRLTKLRRAAVVTTFGTPWWVDWVAMRRPVRRMFRTAVIGACAPQARFDYLPLYAAEAVTEERIAAFERRIAATLAR